MFGILGRRLTIAFVLVILLLIVNAVISFRATNTLIENNQRVVRTQQIIEAIGALVSTAKDAETGQRGYLLTGDEQYLGPYNSALAQIDGQYAQLSELIADNPVQASRAVELRKAIDLRLETLVSNLELYRSSGLEEVRREHALDKGRDQMDAVRRIAADIQSEEDNLLQLRVEQSRIGARDAVLTFIAANLFVLLLIGFAYYLVARDLAERKRAAEELEAANESLEIRVRERTADLAKANTELGRSNRELQDFAFVASHDLQEPLRKIQAFGDRLKSKHGPALNDEARDYLERMHRAAGRMHTLINDLLGYSRVTTKAQPFVQTDLKEIADDVADDLEARIQQTGGRVEIGELPTIDADPLQMRQLFQNLIGNALKFHRQDESPVVRVSGAPADKKKSKPTSTPANGFVLIEVEDNGIGFDEKYLDRIFTPFQRLHGRGEYEGTGIGLAVCRKIVERHGGKLTAISTPGKGSKFLVTLPKKQNKES